MYSVIGVYLDEESVERESVVTSFKTKEAAEDFCDRNEQIFTDEGEFLYIKIERNK